MLNIAVKVIVPCVIWFYAATVSPGCFAHFLWLKTITENGQPHAYMFFGETVTDEAYHFPERLESTDVFCRTTDGQRAKLESEALESGDRIGKIAVLPNSDVCVLEATQQYGIYGKSLLVYYAKHVHATANEKLNAVGRSKELKLDIVPKVGNDEVELTVYWQGEPLSNAKISLAEGNEEAVEKTTDEQGRATFPRQGDGIIGVLASHVDKDASGELDGDEYKGVMHYASLTFGRDVAKSAEERTSAAEPQSALPPLPEPVSSFGAVVADGWLYVYSGHTGEEHQHSAANLSKNFRRIKIDAGNTPQWQELPIQTALQGLPLVAHGGKVYRIGGLHARNATVDDEEDLHSTDEFSEFDPHTKTWKALAPIPVPRSSHNAVVIGDHLYVVGGWHLHGEPPGDWQADALVYDFANPQTGWQKLPEQPFKRRALAVAEWQGKLVAIGGMDDEGETSQQVDIFDPATARWSRGPNLPGSGMAGFGGSACTWKGQLYVSGLRGIVYRFNDAGSAWEEAARLARSRFFHQLLPAGDGGLLAVAGASREGHLADIEAVNIGSARRGRDETAQLPSTGNGDAR